MAKSYSPDSVPERTLDALVSVPNGTVNAQKLALLYDKPLSYVERCLEFHGVTELPRYRTADDGLNAFFSDMTAHFDTTPSMTKQEFTAEVDINVIMKRFAASGYDPSSLPLSSVQGRYGDFTNMPDSYHAALNYVKDTERSFLELDANVRARFDNDPQIFLDFITDPKNADEAVRLGLAVSKPLGTPPDTGKAVGDPKGKVSKKPSPSDSNEGVGGIEGD